MPLLRDLGVVLNIVEISVNGTAENIADAIREFFAKSRRFIVLILIRISEFGFTISDFENNQALDADPITGITSGILGTGPKS